MKFIFHNLFFLCCIISFQIAFGQQPKYAQVKVYTNEVGIAKLAALGLPVDHGEFKKGAYFIGDFSESDLQILKEANLTYEILHADLAAYYAERSKKMTPVPMELQQQPNPCNATVGDYPVPEDFAYGSMAGFLNYEELLAQMDLMAEKYPNLISVKQPIDTFKTHE